MLRHFLVSITFLLFFASSVVYTTLSKSDRKGKPKISDTIILNGGESESSATNMDDSFTAMKVETILKDHNKLCDEQKKFNHPVLAYVTPWNNGGYDTAKRAARKFTHISPVWFQFKPELKPRKTCTIFGVHNVDNRWLTDVSATNTNIHFVPRLIIEGFVVNDLKKFLYDEKWQTDCALALINFIKNSEMHGAVIEIWLQMLPFVRLEAKEELIELIIHWADLFHWANLEIILPVPAPVDHEYKLTGFITENEITELIGHIDYINVMTYDYHSDHFVGIAPFEWIHHNLEYVLSGKAERASKVLLGLNFYGYALHQTTLKTVVGKDFLECLTAKPGVLYWDSKTKEHHFRTKDRDVYIYPTEASLKARLKLADHYNVGVGIWELGQGLRHFTCLL